jgi:hypothetical protein
VTERKAYALLLFAMSAGTVVGVEGLYALGVRGVPLSLGFIVPMVLTGFAVGSMVMHFGEARRRR